MAKAIVHYIPSRNDRIVLGESAIIEHPIDHTSPYVSNASPIFTSQVVRVNLGGEFETRNSIYIPA